MIGLAMAPKSQQAIAERTIFHRWLWWQAVRHHPQYRADVAAILRQLRGLRTKARPRRFDLPNLAQVTQFESLESDRATPGITEIVQVRTPVVGQPPPTAAWLAYLLLWRAAQAPTAGRRCVDDVNPGRAGAALVNVLPNRIGFEQDWGLRFPVPPRMAAPPDGFMTAPAVVPIKTANEQEDLLELHVWRKAGRTALDHLSGILDNYQPHRWPRLPAQPARVHIEKVVRDSFGPGRGSPGERQAYRNELARQAGYSSYAQLSSRAAAAARSRGSIAEHTETVANAMRAKGIPPRQARKRNATRSQITIVNSDRRWLKVVVTFPAQLDLQKLDQELRRRLDRSAWTLHARSKHAYERLFRVCDLLFRKRRKYSQVARALRIADRDGSTARERLINLRKEYARLSTRFDLPRIPHLGR
jgi:hypothetical protein